MLPIDPEDKIGIREVSLRTGPAIPTASSASP
jgi:hypothetical protein